MVVAIWSVAAMTAWILRRGIRWHYQRWLLRSIPRVTALRSRRLLVDPLTPIFQSRRLFT
jgi:hypothetical protein